MIMIFILHSKIVELTLNDIRTGFLGNCIVSACAKFKFLIVFMFYGLTIDFEQINYR